MNGAVSLYAMGCHMNIFRLEVHDAIVDSEVTEEMACPGEWTFPAYQNAMLDF